MIDMNLEAVNSALAATVRKQEEEIKAADAEIKRLRAALERIADTDPDEGTQWFHEVARAALTAQPAAPGGE